MLALAPTILAVIAGVGLGLWAGGDLANVTRWRPAQWPLLAGGLAVKVLVEVASLRGGIAVALSLAATLVLVAWCVANLRTPGIVVVLIGLVLNFIPTAVNWGMPVSRQAIANAGLVRGGSVEATVLSGPRHIEDGDHLSFLGEVIALPTRQVLSVGDVVLHLGYALVVAAVLRGRRLPARDDLPRIPYREAIKALGEGPMPRRGPGTHPTHSAAARRPSSDEVGVRRLPPEEHGTAGDDPDDPPPPRPTVRRRPPPR